MALPVRENFTRSKGERMICSALDDCGRMFLKPAPSMADKKRRNGLIDPVGRIEVRRRGD